MSVSSENAYSNAVSSFDTFLMSHLEKHRLQCRDTFLSIPKGVTVEKHPGTYVICINITHD